MKLFTKSIITKISAFLLLILLGVFISYWIKGDPETNKNKRNQIDQVLVEFISYKNSLWVEGDINGDFKKNKLKCPQYLKNDMVVHSSFFECNPLFYLCLSKEVEKYHGHNFKMSGYEIKDRGAFIVYYTLGDLNFSLRFKDVCRSAYLVKNLYNAGPSKNDKYLWDNYAEDVFIDKQYVNKLDYVISQKGRLEELKDPHLPLLNLDKNEMQKICYNLGGQLLESRYFDAAVNYPSKIVNKVINKYPFPWTKRRELNKSESDSLCYKSFSKECTNIPYIYHSDYSPSWVGIYHALGSFMEFFENKFYEGLNVKVSSKEIGINDIWNRNFYRAALDETQELNIYNERDLRKKEIKDWAFRCMYLK
jgi:hypothetical protein